MRVLVTWLVSTVSLLVAAWIVPGADVKSFWGALVAAAVIAILNAILPPVVAALRLPFMLVLGFVLVLVADALMLLAADGITDGDLRRLVLVGARSSRSSPRRSRSCSRSSSGRTTTTPTRSA